MPSYFTHSQVTLSLTKDMLIDAKTQILDYVDYDNFIECLKLSCIGPDSLISTSYDLFVYQHVNKTRYFFENMINIIKSKKLYNNPYVISFLYGQIAHYIVDVTTHPFIYYVTGGMPKNHLMDYHGLFENWLDDYVFTEIYKKSFSDIAAFYKKSFISDHSLNGFINELYFSTFSGCKYGNRKLSTRFISDKYLFGCLFTMAYEKFRNVSVCNFPGTLFKQSVGDIMHGDDKVKLVTGILNANKTWINPETGCKSEESFDILWKKSIADFVRVISDVNACLYEKKSFDDIYLLGENLSYNTGLNCDKGQEKKYIRKYSNEELYDLLRKKVG